MAAYYVSGIGVAAYEYIIVRIKKKIAHICIYIHVHTYMYIDKTSGVNVMVKKNWNRVE